MPSLYTKSGLGGAGNFRLTSTFSDPISSPLLPIKTPATSFATGIGGAANYRRNSVRTYSSSTCHSSPATHFGIGGAGNCSSQSIRKNSESTGAKLKACFSNSRHTSITASSLSISSDDESASSSFREKLGDFKERIAFRSSRILEAGLDEGARSSRPSYAQLEA